MGLSGEGEGGAGVGGTAAVGTLAGAVLRLHLATGTAL